jgi:hypothetical protein
MKHTRDMNATTRALGVCTSSHRQSAQLFIEVRT